MDVDFSRYDDQKIVVLRNGECSVPIPVCVNRSLGCFKLQFIENELVASIPRMFLHNVFYIKNFLEKHRRWIFKHYKQNFEELKRPLPIPSPCVIGSNIILNGQDFPFVPVETNGGDGVFDFGDGFKVHLELNLADYKEIMEKHIARYAFEKLCRLLKNTSQETGIEFLRVTIRPMRSKWGSCRENGNITLNTGLIYAPETIQKYVCVHELCHLREMNHSEKFWTWVGQFYPEHKKAREWLKEHGFYLG